MKGWHWLYDRFLSLTSATLAQLSAMLIPFYFPPSHPAHTSPCTFCCPCFYTLSHGSLPLLSALPPLSFIPRSPSARTPILSACYSSHTPAQTSLMLIYVTRYSWVDTILKQENQAPEASFIYKERFSSILWLTCVQSVHWCACLSVMLWIHRVGSCQLCQKFGGSVG